MATRSDNSVQNGPSPAECYHHQDGVCMLKIIKVESLAPPPLTVDSPLNQPNHLGNNGGHEAKSPDDLPLYVTNCKSPRDNRSHVCSSPIPASDSSQSSSFSGESSSDSIDPGSWHTPCLVHPPPRQPVYDSPLVQLGLLVERVRGDNANTERGNGPCTEPGETGSTPTHMNKSILPKNENQRHLPAGNSKSKDSECHVRQTASAYNYWEVGLHQSNGQRATSSEIQSRAPRKQNKGGEQEPYQCTTPTSAAELVCANIKPTMPVKPTVQSTSLSAKPIDYIYREPMVCHVGRNADSKEVIANVNETNLERSVTLQSGRKQAPQSQNKCVPVAGKSPTEVSQTKKDFIVTGDTVSRNARQGTKSKVKLTSALPATHISSIKTNSMQPAVKSIVDNVLNAKLSLASLDTPLATEDELSVSTSKVDRGLQKDLLSNLSVSTENETVPAEFKTMNYDVIERMLQRLPTYTIFSNFPAYHVKSYNLLSDIEEVFFPECQTKACKVLQSVFGHMGFKNHMITCTQSLGKVHSPHFQRVPHGEVLIHTPVPARSPGWYRRAREEHANATRGTDPSSTRKELTDKRSAPTVEQPQQETKREMKTEELKPLLGEIHRRNHIFPMVYSRSRMDIHIAASDLAVAFPKEVDHLIQLYESSGSRSVRTATRDEAVSLMRYKAAFGNLDLKGKWRYLTSNSLLISWPVVRALIRSSSCSATRDRTTTKLTKTRVQNKADHKNTTNILSILGHMTPKVTKGSKHSPRNKKDCGKKRKRSRRRPRQSKKKCLSPTERVHYNTSKSKEPNKSTAHAPDLSALTQQARQWKEKANTTNKKASGKSVTPSPVSVVSTENLKNTRNINIGTQTRPKSAPFPKRIIDNTLVEKSDGHNKHHNSQPDLKKGTKCVKKGLWLLQQQIQAEVKRTRSAKGTAKSSATKKYTCPPDGCLNTQQKPTKNNTDIATSTQEDIESVVTSNPFTQSIQALKSVHFVDKSQRLGDTFLTEDISAPEENYSAQKQNYSPSITRMEHSPQTTKGKTPSQKNNESEKGQECSVTLSSPCAKPEAVSHGQCKAVRFSVNGENLLPGEQKKERGYATRMPDAVPSKNSKVPEGLASPEGPGAGGITTRQDVQTDTTLHHVVENPGFCESPLCVYDPVLGLDNVGAFYDVTAENDEDQLCKDEEIKQEFSSTKDSGQMGYGTDRKATDDDKHKKQSQRKMVNSAKTDRAENWSLVASLGEDHSSWNVNVSTGRKLILRAKKCPSVGDLSSMQHEQNRMWEIIKSRTSPEKQKKNEITNNKAARKNEKNKSEPVEEERKSEMTKPSDKTAVHDSVIPSGHHTTGRSSVTSLTPVYRLSPRATPEGQALSGVLVVDVMNWKLHMAYVINNGYPYVALQSVRPLFPTCVKRCGIYKTVVKETLGLGNMMCSFEEAALLTEEDRLINPRSKVATVSSGALLVRADLLMAKLKDIRTHLRSAHLVTGGAAGAHHCLV